MITGRKWTTPSLRKIRQLTLNHKSHEKQERLKHDFSEELSAQRNISPLKFHVKFFFKWWCGVNFNKTFHRQILFIGVWGCGYFESEQGIFGIFPT